MIPLHACVLYAENIAGAAGCCGRGAGAAGGWWGEAAGGAGRGNNDRAAIQEAAAAGDGYAMLALAQQLVDGRFVEQNHAQVGRTLHLLTGPLELPTCRAAAVSLTRLE